VPRKLVLIAVALLALLVPAAAQARYTAHRVALGKTAVASTGKAKARAAATRECANENLAPTPDNLEQVRAAIVCLHNQIRGQRGLGTLKGNTRLRKAAEGHSADMVRKGFFEHTTPSGTTMVDRILRARFVRPSDGWLLGENLAWGTGALATPRGAVDAWMNSPAHRANVLKRGYREVGVGIALGIPTGDDPGVTYTVDFGTRR
jgi:uncharacterized protein YkwD